MHSRPVCYWSAGDVWPTHPPPRGASSWRHFDRSCRKRCVSCNRAVSRRSTSPRRPSVRGMAVYTRFAKVIDAAGHPLSVRDALALINRTLDEVLAEQEGDFDADSRWALAWFEEYGFQEGPYGAAETLSKAKNTSVDGMVGAGILASRAGQVRLLRPEELPGTWDPAADSRLTAWEMVHHLVRRA